jgi:adenosylhomocysteine nucleosidase
MLAINARAWAQDADALSPALPVIAVNGLAFEASIAAGSGVKVICGSDRGALLAGLREAVANGSHGIVSFGIAGGLDPALAPGDCVIPAAVLTDKGRFPTSWRWSQRLLRAFPGAHRGVLAGVDAPVASAAGKRALRNDTGAVAVDTESDLVARIAAAHGLPFVAIRIVVDPAHRPLPPAALVSTYGNGQLDLGSILASVARRPAQVPDLIRLARDARTARAALLLGRQRLGSHLGLPGLEDQPVDMLEDDKRIDPARAESAQRVAAARRPELISFP